MDTAHSDDTGSFEHAIVTRLEEIPDIQKTSIKEALEECNTILQTLQNSIKNNLISVTSYNFLLARCLLLRSGIQAEFRNIESALSDNTQALELFSDAQNPEYIARALIVQSNIKAYSSLFSESLELLKKAEEYTQNIDNPELKANIKTREGSVQHTLGNHEKALELFFEALGHISEELLPIAVASCYNDIASSLTRLERLDEAEEYYNKAIALNTQINNKRGLMRNLSDYGVLFFRRNQFELSLQYHLQALSHALEFGLTYSQGVSYSNLAAAYYNLRDLTQCIEYLKKSLDIQEQNNDKYGITVALSNIAIAYTEMKDFTDAKEFAEQGLLLSQEIGSKEIQALNHNTLAIVCNNLKDFKRAIEHAKNSYTLYNSVGNRLLAGMASFNEATALIELHEYNTAVQTYSSTLTLGEEFHNTEFIVQSLVGITDALLKLRKSGIEINEVELENNLKRLEEITSKESIDNHTVCKKLSEVYELLGKYELALHYTRKADEIQEQIRSGDAAKHILTLKAERELAAKEKERLIIENEKQIALRDAEIYHLENVELAERNALIKSQNDELIEKQRLLNISNEKLRNALTELAELGASRIARTIVMSVLFILFVLSEVLVDPMVELITDSAIFGVMLRFAGALLFRPLETYVEHLAVKKRKESILSIIKE